MRISENGQGDGAHLSANGHDKEKAEDREYVDAQRRIYERCSRRVFTILERVRPGLRTWLDGDGDPALYAEMESGDSMEGFLEEVCEAVELWHDAMTLYYGTLPGLKD